MRLFRFYAYCGSKIDEASLAACSQKAPRLASISKERKAFELLKIIEHDRCLETLELMLQQNILKHLPFSARWSDAIQRLAKLQNLAEACNYQVRACLRIFALFNNFDKTYGNDLLLPLSIKKYLKQLQHLTATADLKAIMALPYRYLYLFKEVLLDGLIYMLSTDGVPDAEARQVMEKFVTLQAIPLPQFPLNGDDLMQRFSMQPGKEIGQLIETAKQLWFKFKCSATRENLLNQLEQVIKR
jgi:tRNA nucleotidyltransferase/poly(A) polymerase